MTKINKWVSSLAAGFIAVAGAVAAEPAQAQTQDRLTPNQANRILDTYQKVLNQTLRDVARDEVRPLRDLYEEECYTLFNDFNPVALPNGPRAHGGTFFVPAIKLDEAVIHTADGRMYHVNQQQNYDTPEDFYDVSRGGQMGGVVSVGCYGTQQDALNEGRMLNRWQADGFLQNGIDKLSAAIKRGLPAPGP